MHAGKSDFFNNTGNQMVARLYKPVAISFVTYGLLYGKYFYTQCLLKLLRISSEVGQKLDLAYVGCLQVEMRKISPWRLQWLLTVGK